MDSEQDGAAQAAKLNALLDEIAKRLVSQEGRITALEAITQGQQELLRLTGEALRGHQAVFEANRLDAAKAPQPQPARGVN